MTLDFQNERSAFVQFCIYKFFGTVLLSRVTPKVHVNLYLTQLGY